MRRLCAVAVLVTDTSVSGITAPVGSLTVPMMAPAAETCP